MGETKTSRRCCLCFSEWHSCSPWSNQPPYIKRDMIYKLVIMCITCRHRYVIIKMCRPLENPTQPRALRLQEKRPATCIPLCLIGRGQFRNLESGGDLCCQTAQPKDHNLSTNSTYCYYYNGECIFRYPHSGLEILFGSLRLGAGAVFIPRDVYPPIMNSVLNVGDFLHQNHFLLFFAVSISIECCVLLGWFI